MIRPCDEAPDLSETFLIRPDYHLVLGIRITGRTHVGTEYHLKMQAHCASRILPGNQSFRPMPIQPENGIADRRPYRRTDRAGTGQAEKVSPVKMSCQFVPVKRTEKLRLRINLFRGVLQLRADRPIPDDP